MKKFTMQQLSEATGVSRRKIRYYIAEGLLDGPVGKGRGSFYKKKHLKRLKEILALRERGLTLDQIRAGEGSLGQLLISGMGEALAHSRGEIELTTHTVVVDDRTLWDHHWLTDNVQVLIKRGLKPKVRRQIAKALRGMATTLEEEDG